MAVHQERPEYVLKPTFVIEVTIILVVWKLTMSGFTHLVVHQKYIKIWFTHQYVVHQLSMLCFTNSFGVGLN